MSGKNQPQPNANQPSWELVIDDDAGGAYSRVHRLKVPGGWIYRSLQTGRGGENPTISMVFVPETSSSS
jgi:hypothetical protein